MLTLTSSILDILQQVCHFQPGTPVAAASFRLVSFAFSKAVAGRTVTGTTTFGDCPHPESQNDLVPTSTCYRS